MTDLLPCPFCGAAHVGVGASQDMEDGEYIEEGRRWSVICGRCGSSCSLYCVSKQAAIEAWNTRVPAQAVTNCGELDPPAKWLDEALRNLARELLADPKTPWIGDRDPKQHICWIAADRLLASSLSSTERK